MRRKLFFKINIFEIFLNVVGPFRVFSTFAILKIFYVKYTINVLLVI